MKKFLLIGFGAALACSMSFGADGAVFFKKCIACHGAKAEKAYLNKVPVLTTVDPAERLELMKGYKAGTVEGGKGKIGQGAIMKIQMSTLSEEDMAAVNEYISTLK